ncbi:MAG: hypothetical protein ABFD25_14520 [Clostridiaceae bacterium]
MRKLFYLIWIISILLTILGTAYIKGEVDKSAVNDAVNHLKSDLSDFKYKYNKMEACIENLEQKQTEYDKHFEYGMEYIVPEYKVRFVEKELESYLLPYEKSKVLRKIEKNSLVSVNDLIIIANEKWLYVTIPTYDTPMDIKGWIKESDTVSYTQDKENELQGDITIMKGSKYYDVFDFQDIFEAETETLESTTRGWIEIRTKGYSRIFIPGGKSFWVKDEDIVFP